jgi:hypothetical protein
VAAVPDRVAGHARVLGIDLGTHCGVSIIDIPRNKPLSAMILLAGQLDLTLGEYDTGPLRFIRLKHFLAVVRPTLIGYEEVRFTPKTEGMSGKPIGMIIARVASASELLGAMKVTVATWAAEHDVATQGYGIGTIKKAATGKGNANKVEMITAANQQFGVHLEPENYESSGHDNIADAMFVSYLAARDYLEGLHADST